MIRLLLSLVMISGSVLCFGQMDSVFFGDKSLSGKVELSRYGKLTGTIKVLHGSDQTSFLARDIDSLVIKDNWLYSLSFKLGPKEYNALGSRIFKGNYELYETELENYGEIVLIKESNGTFPLFAHNTDELLGRLTKEEVHLRDFRTKDIVSYSKEFHEKNAIDYETAPSNAFLDDVKIGFRIGHFKPVASQVLYTKTEYSQKLAFSGGEIFSEFVLGHLVIMPSFRVKNYSFLMDHYDFGARGGIADITVDQKSKEIGLFLKYKITQGRFLNPYISLGVYRIMQNSFETRYEVIPQEDEQFEIHSLVYHREKKPYPAHYGVGLEKNFWRFSLSFGAIFFSYQSPVSMDCTYSTDSPYRFDFVMKGNYEENGYFLHLDLAFSLYGHSQ